MILLSNTERYNLQLYIKKGGGVYKVELDFDEIGSSSIFEHQDVSTSCINFTQNITTQKQKVTSQIYYENVNGKVLNR